MCLGLYVVSLKSVKQFLSPNSTVVLFKFIFYICMVFCINYTTRRSVRIAQKVYRA